MRVQNVILLHPDGQVAALGLGSVRRAKIVRKKCRNPPNPQFASDQEAASNCGMGRLPLLAGSPCRLRFVQDGCRFPLSWSARVALQRGAGGRDNSFSCARSQRGCEIALGLLVECLVTPSFSLRAFLLAEPFIQRRCMYGAAKPARSVRGGATMFGRKQMHSRA